MLRTALRPRWLALLVLVLVLASVMAWLGDWQFRRARENSHVGTVRASASRPAVPVTSLLVARQTFTAEDADRPITAEGHWDGAHQLLVNARYLKGVHGWWVLTPLVLADGSALPVVRGWVRSVDDPTAATTTLASGDVSIQGVLRPGEPPIDRAPGVGSGLPAGQIDGVDLTELVRMWPRELIAGYVVLTDQQPANTGPSLVLVPPTTPSSQTLAWQNISYSLQWFAFAGFGVLIWYRLVRDAHEGRLRPTGKAADPEGASDGDDEARASPSDDRVPSDESATATATATEQGAQS